MKQTLLILALILGTGALLLAFRGDLMGAGDGPAVEAPSASQEPAGHEDGATDKATAEAPEDKAAPATGASDGVVELVPEQGAAPTQVEDLPILKGAALLSAHGLELGVAQGMELTGNRDRIEVRLPDDGPLVVLQRLPYDPAKRGEEFVVPDGAYSTLVERRGRRWRCGAEAVGDSLVAVQELCESAVAREALGAIVNIDCGSENVDRDLFTIRLRGQDDALRSCFTAAHVVEPTMDKAGFGFRADVSAAGEVLTLEVAGDVPTRPAYEEVRGCIYPLFKKMKHEMLEEKPGRVSCEFRWALNPEPETQAP